MRQHISIIQYNKHTYGLWYEVNQIRVTKVIGTVMMSFDIKMIKIV